MKKEELDFIRDFSYGDLVNASIHMLREIREGYAGNLDGELVPPRFPTHVQIQTIGGCNASCVMCPMSSKIIRRFQKGIMGDELFEKIIAECAQYPECKTISPYLQNEPLLDERLADRIRVIKEKSNGRLSARIVTNGSLLDAQRTTELLDAGIDTISISLNAHSPAVYEKVMGGLDFETTVNNINQLLERDLSTVMVTLTFMVTSDNEHEVEEAVSYWSSRGVMCGAYGVGTMTGNVPNFDAVKPSNLVEKEKECYVPMEATSILASGHIMLCCSDWARHSVYGDLNTKTIYEVWHSPELSEIRRQSIFGNLEHPICKKCLGQTKVPENLMYEGGPGKIKSL